ncbi:class I SAM-dependent methyltransferase [bacterium]|nr:class I SAM-dependent methyltransferase [bacterium]
MGYYADNLSGERLRECYEIAPPRVKQYLAAEIAHVLGLLRPGDTVLELGCGYGRVAFELARAGVHVTGIDTSAGSIALAERLRMGESACKFLEMNATALAFPDDTFDSVICIQNGICAFNTDKHALVSEALRVTRPGGRAVFSTYAATFWSERLRWFELQAESGLLGDIDRGATGEGTIVCVDGFRSGAVSPTELREICRSVGIDPFLTEVDGSSLFCELLKPDLRPGASSGIIA